MMSDYFITEFLNIDCDDNGYLTTTFTVEDDPLNHYRTIESEEYYYWALDKFEGEEITDDFLDDDWENNYSSDKTVSTFSEWLMDYHSEDTVLSFIKETYPTVEELPDPTL